MLFDTTKFYGNVLSKCITIIGLKDGADTCGKNLLSALLKMESGIY